MGEGVATRWWETRTFVAAVLLASVVPLLIPAIPPLTDLPGHIGRYRVMLGTDADVLGQWYQFNWRLTGNLGVDLLVAALAPWLGLEPAVKLVVMLIPLLAATGILWIAREVHGRVTLFTPFALALIYNYPFHFGFVNYSLAMALALNAFALWLRLGRQERLRLRAALFVPVSLLVWLAHVVGWGALGLFAVGAELVRHREAGRAWLDAAVRAGLSCLPLAPPALLLLFWRSGGGMGMTGEFFHPIKIAWLASVFRDRWIAFDVGSVLVIIFLLYAGVRDRLRFERSPVLGAAFLLLLIAYILLPHLLFGSAYADMRLAPYLFIIALLAMRARDSLPPRTMSMIALAGTAFFAARIGGTTISFQQYGGRYDRELAALDHVPRGARLVSFVGESCERPWRHTRLNHLPAMAMVRRAAFSNDQWRLEGSALLRVTAHPMGEFATDPSEMVLLTPCEREPGLITIDQSLATLPRDAFDYVWLIAPPRYDMRLTAGMTPVWRSGTSVLYRIDRRR